MNHPFFTKTKKELYESFNQNSTSLNELFILPAGFWELSLVSRKESVRQYLDSIFTINQSLIATITEVKNDLYEGKINNSRDYYESDLQVVDVLVNIYSQFSIKVKIIGGQETEGLKEKVLQQLDELYSCIEHFPEDIATNVKSRPKVISKVSLDYYQLIYLAFTHTQSQINNIQLIKNLSKLAKTPTVFLN
ncbi:MAG: hypothetical protein ACJA0Q_000229 [Saprospiraceae bacterium]|jgi:hypothetical protein